MIKTISSKVIFRNKYGYELYEDKIELKNGQGVYNYLKHKQGFVAICAFDGAKIQLIRNYRYPIKESLWELPKGYIGEKESPLAAAKRELKEETGLVAAKWKKIGVYQALPGFVDIKAHVFLATELKMTKTAIEEDEEIEKGKMFRLNEVTSVDLLTNFAIAHLRKRGGDLSFPAFL